MIYKPSSLKLIRLINNTFHKGEWPWYLKCFSFANWFDISMQAINFSNAKTFHTTSRWDSSISNLTEFCKRCKLKFELNPCSFRQRFIKLLEILVTRSIPSFSFSTAASTEVIRVVTREASTLCRNFSNHFWGQKKMGSNPKGYCPIALWLYAVPIVNIFGQLTTTFL